jgi:hypothetical protein
VQTPQGEFNRPGLPAISYRTGAWATFKESMLARLSSSDYPALARLTTRDGDDFSIAMLDAASVVLDILTFYQERLANENYLRTATQLRSLVEMSRLIGYQPSPGVSALTYLAFTLQAAIGQPPDPTTPAITIPQGTQVQSVPPQGQTPQVFETSADILAKPDWNALPVQTGCPWTPPGKNWLYLAGVSNQLNPGDALLILGIERETWVLPSPASAALPGDQWDIVTLNQAVVDTANNRTYVAWPGPLTHASGHASSWSTAKVFALRQKAALFGNNAPDPNLFVSAKHSKQTSLPDLIDTTVTPWKWANFYISDSNHVDLDATYSKVAAGSWFALVSNGYQVQLYKAASAASISQASFGISAKVTELAADFTDAYIGNNFQLQKTLVLAQSEQLTLAEQPLDHPLYGTVVDLEDLRPDLLGVQAVALSGNSQKLSVNTGAPVLTFKPDDNSGDLTLKPGDVVTIIDPTPLPLKKGLVPHWHSSKDSRTLRVADASGRTGNLLAALENFTLAPSGKSDPIVQECALVSSLGTVATPFPHTRILLKTALVNCYDRVSAAVNANVAQATAGQSVSEIMGSGAAAATNQNFTLKQAPLTFTQAPTATGSQSTLQASANGVAWTEVPTLYAQGPSQQVFATLNQPGGVAKVLFGDGVEGATLPSGRNNIQAKYRIGLGLAGNVGAGTITTLMDRPLGVSGVTNPQAATGGQDSQSVNDIRANAPLSVLTLGRAVSISDYQNFAGSFASIAKASAIWIPSGPGRGVFLTVAAAGGAALAPGSGTLGNLVTALQNHGNPLVPIHAVSFLETLFSISADICYDASYDSAVVKAAVIQALTDNYSFAARGFGQGVSADEVAAFVQAVPGVVAVNVKTLAVGSTSQAGDITGGNYSLAAYTNWFTKLVTLNRLSGGASQRICPYVPIASTSGLPQPAEILVLDPDPKNLVLGVLK